MTALWTILSGLIERHWKLSIATAALAAALVAGHQWSAAERRAGQLAERNRQLAAEMARQDSELVVVRAALASRDSIARADSARLARIPSRDSAWTVNGPTIAAAQKLYTSSATGIENSNSYTYEKPADSANAVAGSSSDAGRATQQATIRVGLAACQDQITIDSTTVAALRDALTHCGETNRLLQSKSTLDEAKLAAITAMQPKPSSRATPFLAGALSASAVYVLIHILK